MKSIHAQRVFSYPIFNSVHSGSLLVQRLCRSIRAAKQFHMPMISLSDHCFSHERQKKGASGSQIIQSVCWFFMNILLPQAAIDVNPLSGYVITCDDIKHLKEHMDNKYLKEQEHTDLQSTHDAFLAMKSKAEHYVAHVTPTILSILDEQCNITPLELRNLIVKYVL